MSCRVLREKTCTHISLFILRFSFYIYLHISTAIQTFTLCNDKQQFSHSDCIKNSNSWRGHPNICFNTAFKTTLTTLEYIHHLTWRDVPVAIEKWGIFTGDRFIFPGVGIQDPGVFNSISSLYHEVIVFLERLTTELFVLRIFFFPFFCSAYQFHLYEFWLH